MSANNYLLIKEEPDHYDIYEKDAETDQGSKVGRSPELRRAIQLASEYMAENIVEYGLHFDLEDK